MTEMPEQSPVIPAVVPESRQHLAIQEILLPGLVALLVVVLIAMGLGLRRTSNVVAALDAEILRQRLSVYEMRADQAKNRVLVYRFYANVCRVGAGGPPSPQDDCSTVEANYNQAVIEQQAAEKLTVEIKTQLAHQGIISEPGNGIND